MHPSAARGQTTKKGPDGSRGAFYIPCNYTKLPFCLTGARGARACATFLTARAYHTKRKFCKPSRALPRFLPPSRRRRGRAGHCSAQAVNCGEPRAPRLPSGPFFLRYLRRRRVLKHAPRRGGCAGAASFLFFSRADFIIV